MPPSRIHPCLRYLGRGLLLPGLLGWGSPLRLSAQISNSGTSSITATVPGEVSGQVINGSTGAPIARSLVRFNQRAVLTNHDGNFQFPQNTDTSGNVLVMKPGYYASLDAMDTPNLYLQAAQLGSPLRLLLYPEALLTGTITAPDGTPLPRISVAVWRSVFDENGHRLMQAGFAQSNSHGEFRLPVQAGDYSLETMYNPRDSTTGLAVSPVVFPQSSSSDTSDYIHLRPGEEQHFDLHPSAGSTHTVSLTGEAFQGSFTGQVQFTALTKDGGTLHLSPTYTRAEGKVDVELPQGSYTLRVRQTLPAGVEMAEAAVTVPDHDVAGIALHFSPVPSIPVELQVDADSTSDNSPPTLQQLNLTLQNDQPVTGQAQGGVRATPLPNQTTAFTPEPGSYHLRALTSGAWYVKSVSYGASEILSEGLVVAPGSGAVPMRVTISNQTGSLAGTVRLKGVPSPCWLYLIATTPSARPVTVQRSSTDGSYSSASVPPGSYRVIAFERRHSANYQDPAALSRYSTWEQTISIKAGDKATLDLDAVPAQEMLP